MTGLVEFLKARLAEAEQRLDDIDHVQAPVGNMASARQEIETKQLRIEAYELAVARQRAEWGDYSAWLDGGRGEPSLALDGPDPKLIPGLELALKQDALPYASHPEYDESWRP